MGSFLGRALLSNGNTFVFLHWFQLMNPPFSRSPPFLALFLVCFSPFVTPFLPPLFEASTAKRDLKHFMRQPRPSLSKQQEKKKKKEKQITAAPSTELSRNQYELFFFKDYMRQIIMVFEGGTGRSLDQS